MKLRVDVTQEDIANGRKRNPSACMVARAINRASEGMLQAQVCYEHGWLGPELDGASVKLPLKDSVKQLVVMFDQGMVVQPFSFELELPEGLAA